MLWCFIVMFQLVNQSGCVNIVMSVCRLLCFVGVGIEDRIINKLRCIIGMRKVVQKNETQRLKSKALLMFGLLCFSFFLSGCTDSDTIIVNRVGSADGNFFVGGDLNVLGDINFGGYLYGEMPHLFGLATTIQHPVAVGSFQEIVFDYTLGDMHDFTIDGNCILVEKKGHYFANLEVFFQDNAVASATTTTAIIISQNGSEVSGSYSEINLDKQYSNQSLTTFAYIDANIDDRLCMEWAVSKATTDIAMENNYSVQPITAKGFINWVHAD